MTFPLTSAAGLILIALAIFALASLPTEVKVFSLLAVYLGGILLLTRIVSNPILISLLFVGVSNCVVLAAGHFDRYKLLEFPRKKTELVYYLLLWILFGLISYAAESKIKIWLPLPDSILLAVIFILLSALITMTLEQDLLNAFICLQCVFFSFELVYLLLEGSVLIFVCLTGISLLISLVGAYVNLPNPKPEWDEEDIL